MENVKFTAGVDSDGKYIMAEYEDGRQEIHYFTGHKKDNNLENLTEKYPELRKKTP